MQIQLNKSFSWHFNRNEAAYALIKGHLFMEVQYLFADKKILLFYLIPGFSIRNKSPYNHHAKAKKQSNCHANNR